MKKKTKIIIYVCGIIVMFILAMAFAYNIVKDKNESSQKDTNSTQNNENIEENNNKETENNTEKIEGTLSTTKYDSINKESVLANSIFSFVPKELQTYKNKMSTEYMTFIGMEMLKETGVEAKLETKDGFLGYSSSDVLEKVKEIYGENAYLLKQNTEYYVYDSTLDALAMLPYSNGTESSYNVIKEVREYSDRYELYVYLVNIVDSYDECSNNIYVASKETLSLYDTHEEDYEKIMNSMIKYIMTSNSVTAEEIVDDFSSKIPVAKYVLTKIDSRGTKYYLSDFEID